MRCNFGNFAPPHVQKLLMSPTQIHFISCVTIIIVIHHFLLFSHTGEVSCTYTASPAPNDDEALVTPPLPWQPDNCTHRLGDLHTPRPRSHGCVHNLLQTHSSRQHREQDRDKQLQPAPSLLYLSHSHLVYLVARQRYRAAAAAAHNT